MDWFGSAITAVLGTLLLSGVVSRPLQLDFSVSRRLAAGAVAFGAAVPIMEAITPAAVAATATATATAIPAPFPLLWYVLLGGMLATLLAMVLLVLAEVLVPSGSLPGPVALVRSLPGRRSRARRFAAITRILLRRGLAAYVFTRQRPDLATPEGRTRLARSVRAALEDAGVSFVKLGQILATRPDLLPPEFVDELTHLQSRARPVPWSAVETVIRTELGADPATVFSRIDPEPLATASIAQVHTATLLDGGDVVLKVQRPGIAPVGADDMEILARLARRLERRASWAARLGVVALVDGFAASLREELDFRMERRNLAAVDPGPAAVVRTPAVYAQHSTARLLVLERIHGRPVTEAPPQLRPRFAHALLEALLTQIMVGGRFHADPHPGNILYTDTPDGAGQLVWLDLGSVGVLDAGLRASLVRLLVAVDGGDASDVRDVLLEIADAPDALDERRLDRDLGRFLARFTASGGGTDPAVFVDLVRILADHGVTAPPELAAVFRAIGTLDGTLTALDPGFDLVAEARRYATTRLTTGTDPDDLRRRLTTEAVLLLPMLRRLPHRVDRIVGALEAGTLTVRVAPRAGHLARPAAGVVGQLVTSALAAATGLMAALLLTAPTGPEVGPGLALNGLLGYLLLMVAAVLGLRALVRSYRT
ncbi:AarF/ABC1/UbiB kinase family protein [Pseudonocardia sp. ICBG601]|uniref:ABC1 kinase family protein n=1 Tax=Pseudonocardia sp. ICBG601 TaxID=2846759 RepID=UPI001CF6B74F|nr:AarF/UbiB family protein [Pseudonocardia sp. ICBG601]